MNKWLWLIPTIGFIWTAYLFAVGPIIIDGYCLQEYGTSQVTWANPMWFSCGNKIDPYMENYYTQGVLPPLTIQSYKQWRPNK